MSKYKGRLFTFGCSFTKYLWPTWAYMLGKEFEEHYNYGHPGGGNLFIACSVSEAIASHNITADDTVIIMWTNVAREDRYIGVSWHTPGNIFTQKFYSKEFVEKYVSMRGFYIRDLAQINLVKNTLENIGCKHEFLSMVDITADFDQYRTTQEDISKASDVLSLYQSTIDKIKPSVYEIIFNNDWWDGKPLYKKGTSERIRRYDLHPLPIEHLEYLERVLPTFEISEETKNQALKISEDIISFFERMEVERIPGNFETIKKMCEGFGIKNSDVNRL